MKKVFICLWLTCQSVFSFGQWVTSCATGNGFVDNMEVYNNELYATGFFTTLCDSLANHIAKFDGSTWQKVGTGYSFAGHQLKVLDSSLYFVGYQPNIDSNWLFKFDGNNFNKLGEGFYLTTAVVGFSQTANLYAITKYNNKVIVCGEFDRIGGKRISGIAQWDGSSWDSLGSGLSGNIASTAPVMYPHDMCIFNNDLIVVGNFASAGGVAANGVARWDGTQWTALGSGFNSTVYGVCVYNGELYAGGDFTASGSTTLKYIAKWDGSNWVDPGFNMYYNNVAYYSFIHTLKVINNKMYIGGGFDRVQVGATVYRGQAICAYDGTTVDTLFGGLPGKEVEGIAWFNNELYASGGINNNNSYIAKLVLNTSVQELDEMPVCKVYPNPLSSGAMLTLESTQQIQRVTVYNAMGAMVLSQEPFNTRTDLQMAQAGLYFVELQTEKGLIRKQVVVY